MEQIHHPLQVVSRPIAGCGAEKAGLLIAPGFVAGMLPQRHQLHIIVTVLLQIGDQLLRQLIVAVPVLPFLLSPGRLLLP